MTAKRLYFFQGTSYIRFDSDVNMVPAGYPQPIASSWPGLFHANISAALNGGPGRAYFFSENLFSRFDVLTDTVPSGYPKPIAGNWPGMEGTGFENGIDAAVNRGDRKAYFFRGSEFLRYDLEKDAVDSGYPKPILDGWAGLKGTEFLDGIDAAINYGNDKMYFFKGDRYVRIDLPSDRVDDGFPKPIADVWPGVFTDGIDAALEWPYAEVDSDEFSVPNSRGGCTNIPGTKPWSRSGERFSMNVRFADEPYPASSAVGEYRQYVRGTFTVGGVKVNHGLPNPGGGAPRTMLPTPTQGAATDHFQEDGLVNPPSGSNVWYGHRLDVAGNVDVTDRYAPDRETGSAYHGSDFPSVIGVRRTFVMQLDFRGDAVDRARGDVVLNTNQWSVDCSGTL